MYGLIISMKSSLRFFVVVSAGSLALLLLALYCLYLPRGQVERYARVAADEKNLATEISIDPVDPSRGSSNESSESQYQGLVYGPHRCQEDQRFSGPDGQLQCVSLTPSEVNGVKYFVFFIGYSRSGHSIIGSMMDAHPNMIIAHEYFLFRKFAQKRFKLQNKATLFNELLDNSCSSVHSGWRSNASMKGAVRKGYVLALPSLWQGCFTDLRVIGDKSGGTFTDAVTTNPVMANSLMKTIQKYVKLPIVMIHVVRNPFDMIATEVTDLAFIGAHRWEHLNTTTRALPDPDKLTKVLTRYQERAASIQEVQDKWGMDILEIHHADFIHDPKKVLQEICDFLHLDCPADYLEECHSKTFKTISKTRYLVEWPPHAVRHIEKMIREYSFFRRYSFDSD